jgi:hypothetical protein
VIAEELLEGGLLAGEHAAHQRPVVVRGTHAHSLGFRGLGSSKSFGGGGAG